ncbi:peptidoglycan editing factor PgeF [Candidatus Microgenomates bacterium]|nr:peptidoglycan editing factor PgeF [Candidatus Microgenomates bacterium]
MSPLKFKIFEPISWVGYAVSIKADGDIRLKENRKKFFSSIGQSRPEDDEPLAQIDIADSGVVDAEQVHGNHVAIVGSVDRGDLILKTDALITADKNTPLFIRTADCVPIFLIDQKKKIVGLVHAGWKGTVQEITRITVNHMQDHFGSNPADLLVGMGPAIGSCCYEVDTPVIEQFKYKFKYADKLFSNERDSHARLDLPLANKFQLIETGVKEKNIEISGVCTYDNSSEFFSERKEGPTGRFGSLIYIK